MCCQMVNSVGFVLRVLPTLMVWIANVCLQGPSGDAFLRRNVIKGLIRKRGTRPEFGSFPLTVTITTMGYRRYFVPSIKTPIRTVTDCKGE